MDARIGSGMAPCLSLRKLFYFATVAEELHISRAAERLHISQPPLTQCIQALERDLGIPLFTRTGHQMKLTEGGRLILTEAKAILAQSNRVREMARRIKQGEMGNLHVSVRSSASFLRAFRDATEAFRVDHPSVTINLVQMPDRIAIEALQQHKIDACLLRSAGPHIDGIHQVVVARDRMMLALPSNHRMAVAPKIALADVVGESFIEFAHEGALYKHSRELWARAGLAPRVIQKAESGLTILCLVAGGFGNGILPSTLSQAQMPNVVWKLIDVDEQLTFSAIVMLYQVEARNESIPSFVDYVRHYSPEPHASV